MQIKRPETIQEIIPWLKRDKIIILKGSRQVGKSTLMAMLWSEIRSLEPSAEHISLLADLEDNQNLFQSPKTFLSYLKHELGEANSKHKKYIFIDEFQYIHNSGIFLKNLFDLSQRENYNYQFIVTGSSSLEITKNTEFLTGRKIVFEIGGINFKEFCGFRLNKNLKSWSSSNIADLNEIQTLYKTELQHYLQEYLFWGGYPEAINNTETKIKESILKEIISTYIQKDIANFLKVENTKAFNHLIHILTEQIGSQINKSELANTLNISEESVNKYLSLLEGTYVIDLIKPFSSNLRKELSKTPKIFIRDLAIRTFYASFSPLPMNLGHIIENFCYQSLKFINQPDKINYYRTKSGSEIDFILQKRNKIYTMEIKYQNKKISQPTSAMKNFNANYPVEHHFIISKDQLEHQPQNNLSIIPAYLLPFYIFED